MAPNAPAPSRHIRGRFEPNKIKNLRSATSEGKSSATRAMSWWTTTAADNARCSGLVVVDCDAAGSPESDERWRGFVAAAAERCGEGELRVFFQGGCAVGVPTQKTLTLLALCYDAVAATAPALNLIPMLPSAGWDAVSVGMRRVCTGVGTLVYSEHTVRERVAGPGNVVAASVQGYTHWCTKSQQSG